MAHIEQRLSNEGLLEEYLYYQTLVDNLDFTLHSDDYIRYVICSKTRSFE